MRAARAVVVVSVIVTGAACASENSERAEPPGTEETTTTAAPTSTTSGPPDTSVPGGACSADELASVPPEQPDLPPPVAATRREIVKAPKACDYERLEEIAFAGSQEFTFTFGSATSPAEHWRTLEEGTDEPLRFLAELLVRPYGTVASSNPTLFAWPSAFTYDQWRAVPADERESLRPLYGDRDFKTFDEFGSYLGYRIGITAGGEWLFFVAGD